MNTIPRKGVPIGATVDTLESFYYVFTQTVRRLATWVVDVPEVEVKILAGNHIHKDAVAAAALKTRLLSLGCRLPSIDVVPDSWAAPLAAVGRAAETPVRLYGMYEHLKRRLRNEVRLHIDRTHHVMDEPSVVILRQIESDLDEQLGTAAAVLDFVIGEFYPSFAFGDLARRWGKGLEGADGAATPPLPDPPRRDRRFSVVDEAPFPPFGDREATITALHAMLMCIEIPTIEVCARMIVDFPDMPHDFVMDMSRQCWDESRHSVLCYDRILQMGGRIGQFPVDQQVWQMSAGLPLPVRLAVHQRIGEWLGVDGAILNAAAVKGAGDEVTARLFEYVTADEITHVGYGNKWIRFFARDDASLRAIHEAAAQQRARAGKTIAGPAFLPFNRWACELAGFTAAEIVALERARSAKHDENVINSQP